MLIFVRGFPNLSSMSRSVTPDLRSASVFSHLTAEKAALYRAILLAFMQAKTSFALHLRPADVRAALRTDGIPDESDIGGIEVALTQLCEWRNLEAHRDTADVTTVEEFYRPRFLYQLTLEGEAAEQALALFFETLVQPGELQATALADICQYLGELSKVAESETADESVAHRVLHLLTTRFEQLTARAQTFLRSLQRTIDLHGISVETFLSYKQTLIDYLERFIGELVIATHEIAGRLREIERHGVERLLEAAAQRDVVDALEHEKEGRLNEARQMWTARWAGLRRWFISDSGRQSQAEVLRSRARAAIPALLTAVARINDRRITRSDRVADLQALARWFAEAPTDGDTHRLWRAAFGLAGARHLRVDDDTLEHREQDPVPPQTSWLEAEPLRISPRVRQSGRHVAKGPAKSVIDRSNDKEYLARLAHDEALLIAAAQRRLARGVRVRLSDFGELETTAELDLFLDLLGEALASKVHAADTAVAHSTDGSLRIELEPAGDGGEAEIITADGILRGEDHYVTITNVFDEADAEHLEAKTPAAAT
jgi:uncharacterized protein (TIGR02677 family)